jgi:hypothetical protein
VILRLYKSCSISTKHCFFVHRFSILLFPVVDSLVQILPAAGLGLASARFPPSDFLFVDFGSRTNAR